MKVAVKNLENKEVGELDLDESVFGTEIKTDVLHRVVNWQLAKRRSGTHKTQTRSEVNGRSQKPWRQKGTGRARAADLRRPQDKGGYVVFGPVVRSHAADLPKKIRSLGMRIALSSKVRESKLIIIEDAKAKDHKTAKMASAFKGLGFDNALIVAGNEIDANFARATHNLPRIDVLPTKGANVYDIMRRDVLVLTKEAVNDLTEKLKG